jgi:hypothetical protein
MSKKLYSTQKWKDYIRARQKAEERNARRRKTGPRFTGTAAQKQQVRSRRRFQTVEAPSVFSIVNNPDEAMRFFANLELYSGRYNINLDLSKVGTLTTDAIAALIATLHRLDVSVRGNLPRNADAERMLLDSGFFDYVSSTQLLPKVKRGSIEQQRSKMVEPGVAADLVHFGTKGIGGASQKCTAAYSTLIECMANTRNHASGRNDNKNMREGRRPPETWWATVYADAGRGKICFTFVDTGVGIFRSVCLSTVRKIYNLFGGRDDADILRDMLEGRVPSSTNLSYRGKGLPSMNRLALQNRLSSLVIVANDVYGNVSSRRFERLRASFHGTLVYWEI